MQFSLSFYPSSVVGFVMLELILCKFHFSFAIWLSVKFGQKLGFRRKLKYRKRKKHGMSVVLFNKKKEYGGEMLVDDFPMEPAPWLRKG